MLFAAVVLVVGIVVLAVLKLAAPHKTGSLKGLPWHQQHEFFWGSARYLKRLLEGNVLTLFEDNLEQHRANDFRNYGSSIVGGKTVVVVCMPEDVKCILKTSFSNFEKDVTFQENFRELLGNGIFNVNAAEWKSQRAIASQLFSRRQLRDRMSHVFGLHAQQLVRILRGKLDGPVEIQPYFYNFTFDAINSIAFNRYVNSLSGNAEDCSFQKAFDQFQQCVVSRFIVPWWKVNRALQLSPEERTITSCVKKINEYVFDVVGDYVDANGQVRDDVTDDQTLTGLFLQSAVEEGRQFKKEFVRDMILNFVIAGRDTTASGLTSCIEFLTAPGNEHWQQQLGEEALRCFAGSTTDPLTFDDIADRSPIAEAVFLEAIRLHPPVPSNEKVCIRETKLPSGTVLKAGVYASWAPISTNRMPSVFGQSAEVFDPQRWITAAGRITTMYDDFMFPTFNAGPRLCLGKGMAILEAKIALLTIFAGLRFSRTLPNRKVSPITSITWQLQPGFEVNVHLAPSP